MNIRSLDDIDREKRIEETEQMKKDMSETIDGMMKGFEESFRKRKITQRKKESKVKTFFKSVLIFIGFIFLLVLILNFVLGNIWLLKKLIKSLFGI